MNYEAKDMENRFLIRTVREAYCRVFMRRPVYKALRRLEVCH